MIVAQRVALRPSAGLRGSLELPSDKSISHRALICAALANGKSRVLMRSPGADVRSTLSALETLGVPVLATEVGEELVVWVSGLGEASAIGRLGGGVADCGNSGTSMRLLSGALASGSGAATLTGDASLTRRPMDRIADPLRQMGADIDLDDGHSPVTIRGRRPLKAINHKLNVASAQVLGAISLAALAADGVTTVTVPGTVRDHTERMLSALGVDIQHAPDPQGTTTTIDGPSGLSAFELNVPGDFSSAAAWTVVAAIHPDAGIHLSGVGLNPTRTALLDVLRHMGAEIDVSITEKVVGEPLGNITVQSRGGLHPIELGDGDVAQLIDELPLLAVAMAAADGTSEVRGAAELRVKESDRIAAIGAALTAAGANFEELPDGWRITPGKPRDARVVTHGDHRIAMAMAVAAWSGVARSVELDDTACVAVSYPTFWRDAERIGAM